MITVTGGMSMSRQLFSRASRAADLTLATDVLGALDTSTDSQVINGTGGPGQVTGLLAQGSTSIVACTDATPTWLEMMPTLAATATTAAWSRKMLSNLIVMHSRPWLWVTSRAEAATPALVATGPVTGQPDTVGAIFGVPVMVDDNIPTNLGTGTDEDRILTLRTGDHLLFEDRPRVMIDENRAAGSGGVKLVAFRYVAFTAAWYPGGVGILAGSGLNAVAS